MKTVSNSRFLISGFEMQESSDFRLIPVVKMYGN
jgi:hypothetical protein